MSRVAHGSNDDLTSWLMARPRMAQGVGALSDAVYNHSSLPLRIREIARIRIAEDNECQVCRHTRDAQGEAEGVDEALYENILEWRTFAGYSERERIAAEFAERFAQDHRGLRDDDDFWARAKEHYTDEEIVDLGICCSMWLGNGRLMRVLDVAQACSLTLHEHSS